MGQKESGYADNNSYHGNWIAYVFCKSRKQ